MDAQIGIHPIVDLAGYAHARLRTSRAEATMTRGGLLMTALRMCLDRLEARGTAWLAGHAILLLRVGLGVVFTWFGVLKFFPGASPAQDLAGRTIDALTLGLVPSQVSLPLLAATETLIGLGLISGRCLRAALLALVLQMLGTLTPLVLFPTLTFAQAPYAPTMEGQYILKNIVLVAAALVIGATVRGGGLVANPVRIGGRVVSCRVASRRAGRSVAVAAVRRRRPAVSIAPRPAGTRG